MEYQSGLRSIFEILIVNRVNFMVSHKIELIVASLHTLRTIFSEFYSPIHYAIGYVIFLIKIQWSFAKKKLEFFDCKSDSLFEYMLELRIFCHLRAFCRIN